MDLLLEAVAMYNIIDNDEIQSMRSQLYSILNGADFDCDDMVITSDPGEDTDDILMIKYILTRSRSKNYVIISGGALTPDERLDHLKRIFPEFASAQFNVQFGNIVFMPDGVDFDQPVKCYVNCGPCSSKTLKSIFKTMNKYGGRIITVGANSDGTAVGINQKQTDEGTLKDLCWNECLATFHGTIRNLDVNVSRYVLLPHPSRVLGEYRNMPSECLDEMIITLAMFFSSRPPAKFAKRVNEGNSVVVSQHINVMEYKDTPAFSYGLELISKYAITCPTRDIAVSAAIPLMATALKGGVYKEGVFGFDPRDKQAKMNVSCLTPESAPIFISNLRKSAEFSPGYDLLAIILAKK